MTTIPHDCFCPVCDCTTDQECWFGGACICQAVTTTGETVDCRCDAYADYFDKRERDARENERQARQ